MEFKSLKNIETSFRQIRTMGIVFVSLCALVTGYALWSSYRFAERQREKIYVLDNGKSLILALSQDLSQNRPVEAKEHIRRFHELFFTLSPDKAAMSRISAGRCSCATRVRSATTRTGRKGVLQPYNLGQYQPEHPGGQRGVRFQQLPVCGDNLRTAVARQVEQHHGTEPCNPLPAVELGQVGQ